MLFERIQAFVEEKIQERLRKEAKKKAMKLIGKVIFVAVLCFAGVMIFRHRHPILSAILGLSDS